MRLSSVHYLATVLVCCMLTTGRALEPGSDPVERVLLVTLQAVRADRVGCYGYAGVVTPGMDSLAARGVRFERAYAPTPMTVPSVLSIFTGVDPGVHGVRVDEEVGRQSSRSTIGQLLQQRGFRTAAFVGTLLPGRSSILRSGFDYFNEPSEGHARSARDVVGEALRWWTRAPDQPTFAWVHLADADVAAARYDAAVREMDRHLQRLVRIVSPDTLVIVTGVCGHMLGERGEPTHGLLVFEPALRVPMLVAGPGCAPGHVVAASVAVIDLFNTVLDCVGVPLLTDTHSESLRAALTGQEVSDRLCYSESLRPWIGFGWRGQRSLIQGRWQLIDAAPPALYDLAADEHPRPNVADTHGDVVALLRDRLAERCIDADRPTPPWSTDAPDPSIRIDVYHAFLSADALSPDQDAIALEKLTELARRLPNAPAIHRAMARRLERTRQWPDALAAWQRVVELRTIDLDARRRVLTLQIRLRRQSDAVAQCQDILRLDPDDAGTLGRLARLLIQQKDFDGAIAAGQRAAELDPDDSGYLRDVGLALHAMGRFPEAIEHLEEAVSINPSDTATHDILGMAYAASGSPDDARRCFEAVLGLDPANERARRNLTKLLTQQGRTVELATILRELQARSPHHAGIANDLAWMLATSRLKEVRNVPEAIRYAELAVELDGRRTPVLLGTLGVALAQAGRFDEAVDVTEEALKAAAGPRGAGLQQTLRARLEQFRQGRSITPRTERKRRQQSQRRE